MNVNKSQELQKTRPIITVKQARRFLGEDFKDMSDTEIAAIVDDLRELAAIYLGKTIVKKSTTGLKSKNGLPKKRF